jgi:hypothetical protein
LRFISLSQGAMRGALLAWRERFPARYASDYVKNRCKTLPRSLRQCSHSIGLEIVEAFE